MPFDSAGVFQRVRVWVSDAAAGVKIRADFHDAHDGDLAAGLSQCITKDGRTQPTANLPMNGKKLTNLGEPSQPNDAVTKNYVDNIKSFGTGMIITGANNPNGLIQFSATTGFTGLYFANAGVLWVGKQAEAGKWRGHIGTSPDGVATGLLTIDSGGMLGLNSGHMTHNVSHDGANWRANYAGIGTIMAMSNGVFRLHSNDTPTVQDNQIMGTEMFFQVTQNGLYHYSNDSSQFALNKKNGTDGYGNYIYGNVNNSVRWRMDLGDGGSEAGGGYNGSQFYIYAADNAGTNYKPMFHLNRSNNYAQFWGDVWCNTGNFNSNIAQAVLAANGGPVILRPYGPSNGTYQTYQHTDGYFHIGSHSTIDAHTTYGTLLGLGSRGKNGIYGGFATNWHNFIWADGLLYATVDNTNVGAIQMVCDYRTKRNVALLPSTWDAVKGLRPIKYQYKAFRGITDDEDNDEERWGFVAHELQQTLTPSAASFHKDVKNALQSPNLIAVVAALTKALQEAQARIEALEARQG